LQRKRGGDQKHAAAEPVIERAAEPERAAEINPQDREEAGLDDLRRD
jgi:hypothetical protein